MINILNTYYNGDVIKSIRNLQKERKKDDLDKVAVVLSPEYASVFNNFKTIVTNRE